MSVFGVHSIARVNLHFTHLKKMHTLLNLIGMFRILRVKFQSVCIFFKCVISSILLRNLHFIIWTSWNIKFLLGFVLQFIIIHMYILTGFLKTASMKNVFWMIFDFTTPKDLKIIPSDREEQERADKRVKKKKKKKKKKRLTFFEYLFDTFSGERKKRLTMLEWARFSSTLFF